MSIINQGETMSLFPPVATVNAHDKPSGELLKVAGINRVAANNEPWSKIGGAALRMFAASTSEFSAGDFQNWYTGPEPSHPNAWSALFQHAVRAGMLERTGRYVPSPFPPAHARMVPLYRSKVC